MITIKYTKQVTIETGGKRRGFSVRAIGEENEEPRIDIAEMNLGEDIISQELRKELQKSKEEAKKATTITIKQY